MKQTDHNLVVGLLNFAVMYMHLIFASSAKSSFHKISVKSIQGGFGGLFFQLHKKKQPFPKTVNSCAAESSR